MNAYLTLSAFAQNFAGQWCLLPAFFHSRSGQGQFVPGFLAVYGGFVISLGRLLSIGASVWPSQLFLLLFLISARCRRNMDSQRPRRRLQCLYCKGHTRVVFV